MPSDHKTYYGGASVFAMIGIGLFVFNFHNAERYFQNEPLTTKAVTVSDTPRYIVRTNELGSLRDSNSRVRVMGLYRSDTTLVDPAYVFREDSEGRTINLVAGVIAFAIAVIFIVLSIVKR